MGLIRDLVRPVRNQDYTMEQFTRDVRSFFTGRKSSAGAKVNEESALRLITVYSCARVLSETLGAVPLHVYRRRPDGGSDLATDHYLYESLYGEPNDEMSSQSWLESQQGHMTLGGNAYSILQHSMRGEVIDIYPVDWNQVLPRRDPVTRQLEYWVMDRGKPERYPASKVLHVPGWGFDGVMGYSPVRMAAEAIGLGLAATEFAGRFYSQGMNMGVVLEHPGLLGPEGRQNLKEDVMERGAGMENAWQPLILEENMKLSRIPMPLREAQFVESQKFNRDEICGLFRVPPHMVANLDRATFSNIEHQDIGFAKHTMLPIYRRWEQQGNRRLFTRRERQQGYYIRFNIDGLLRGDYKSRQEGLAIQRQNGVINADDWRRREEINPIGGVAGGAYLVNGNMISTETAVRQQPRNTGSAGGENGGQG